MHVKLTNGVPTPYTIGQLRRDNPQTSFPKSVPDEILASYDVYPVKVASRPDYDPLTQTLKQSDFYQVDGQWQVHYYPDPLPVSVQIENLKAARAAAYQEEADPLFFKAQRDEVDMAEWEAKVQEIRNRFPYPETEV
jgi:hypothetical protein